MKRLFIFLTSVCLYMSPLWAQNPGTDDTKNYLRTTIARKAVPTEVDFQQLKTSSRYKDKQEIVEYMDGLGRPMLIVDWRSGADRRDVVTFHDYDELGREPKAYLPYTWSTMGQCVPVSQAINQQETYYNPSRHSDTEQAYTYFPFAETQFEASPLNRVIEQGAPGESWQLQPATPGTRGQGEHSITNSYEVNTTPVRVPIIDTDCQTMDISFQYPAGSLKMVEVIDENGMKTRSYVDKVGRTILRSSQENFNSSANMSDFAHTAYVYNCYGQVAFVIQPEGYKALINGNWSATIQAQYTFAYKYDGRGRVIEKKVPEADWVYMVYDQRDRVVLTQDGNQRAASPAKWSFTTYDELDRPIITGIYQSNYARGYLQSTVGNPTAIISETRAANSFTDQTGAVIEGYTRTSFPLIANSAIEVHAVRYFDDYDFDYDQQPDLIPDQVDDPRLPNVDEQVNQQTIGLVTGVRIRVLDPDPDMPDWLWTVTWYDDRNREYIMWAENHLSNARNVNGWLETFDRTQYTYSFIGEIKDEYHLHRSKPASLNDPSNTLTRRQFYYNHRSLPLYTKEGVALGTDRLPSGKKVVENQYNKLGQVRRYYTYSPKSGKQLQETDLRLNERGWLTHINDVNEDKLGSDQVIKLKKLKVTGHHFNSGGELVSRYTLYATLETESIFCDGTNSIETEIVTDETARLFFADAGSWPGFQEQTIEREQDFGTGLVITAPSTLPAQINTTIKQLIQDASGGFPTVDEGTTYLTPRFPTFLTPIFHQGDLFAMELAHDVRRSDRGSPRPAYNGNVSFIEWQTKGECAIQTYAFRYDGLSRLTRSDYREFTPGVGGTATFAPGVDMDTYYSYDLNGNFEVIRRKGLLANGQYGFIDWFANVKEGNRLIRASDNIPNADVAPGVEHLRDVQLTVDYSYDANGNMTQDLNTSTSVAYNHLNKPTTLSVGTSTGIVYIYSADGTKLRQRTTVTDPVFRTTKVTDYVGGHHYLDPDGDGTAFAKALDFVKTGDYRIVLTPGLRDVSHEFTLEDHLGNTRVQYREDPNNPGLVEVISTHDFYPFGMEMIDGRGVANTEASQYLYNGKEFQDELGLNWYDYGARMYNPTLGRWNGVDALAEDYLAWSPYNYAMNNPILLVDPDGNSVEKGDKKIIQQRYDLVNGEGKSIAGAEITVTVEKDYNPDFEGYGAYMITAVNVTTDAKEGVTTIVKVEVNDNKITVTQTYGGGESSSGSIETSGTSGTLELKTSAKVTVGKEGLATAEASAESAASTTISGSATFSTSTNMPAANATVFQTYIMDAEGNFSLESESGPASKEMINDRLQSSKSLQNTTYGKNTSFCLKQCDPIVTEKDDK